MYIEKARIKSEVYGSHSSYQPLINIADIYYIYIIKELFLRNLNLAKMGCSAN